MHRPAFFAFLFIFTSLCAQSENQSSLYEGTPLNPAIRTMVDAVSADSIEAYIAGMVSFYTRHSNSDTSSADTGIGAARRWVKSKFEATANATGNILQPEFFWFIENICGISGLHANVNATLPGTLTPERYFMVSGHLDSRNAAQCDAQIFAPGANDDASGSAISVELARIMSHYAFESSLVFINVTGEDVGLIGSTAYADWLAANNWRIDGMLTNDVVGNIIAPDGTVDSSSVRHFSVGPSTSSSRQLSRYFKLKGEQYVTSMKVNLIPAQDRPGRGGDHIPFNNNGYAAVRFTEPVERLEHQHSNTDILENMSPAYTAQIARLSLAGLASLALAPETPPGALTVQDLGSGTELLLSWPQLNTEPDFAGYRVAWRHPDSLFYQNIDSVGNISQFTLSNLTPETPVFISYSAIDNDGNESIFSAEVLEIPNLLPAAPQNFNATSSANAVAFQWSPNNELDLERYILTKIRPDSIIQEFLISADDTTFTDNTAQAGVLYRYHLQAVDTDNNRSIPSETVFGRLVSHDQGILLVDFSRDGQGGALFPTDDAVDDFYDTILDGFPVAAEWDVADSLQNNLSFSDAHLGAYQIVIFHSDVRSPSHFIFDQQEAIAKYLDAGGKMLMSGWEILFSASRNGLDVKEFFPGDFVYDYLNTKRALVPGQIDFHGAFALAPGFPDIAVDSLKMPLFNHNLPTIETFSEFVDSANTTVTYGYDSSFDPPSPDEGAPVAFYLTAPDLQMALINFPLYYMEENEAAQLISQTLVQLGQLTDVSPEALPTGLPTAFSLAQNYPNPFNPETVIRYTVPRQSHVKIIVYDMLGRKVQTLVDGVNTAGIYQVKFHGKDLASGIYLYRLEAGAYNEVRKMLLLR